MILKSINPLTGKKIKEYKCFSENKVNSLINNVYDNYQLWKNISIEKRSELLLSVGKKLKSELDIHSRMISTEMGKPIRERPRKSTKKLMRTTMRKPFGKPMFL